MSDLHIQHDPARGRFHAQIDGHSIELDYQRSGSQLIFHHTGVAPALEGRGLAAKLVTHGLQWAATQDVMQVVPACSYVAAFIRRQPRWQRLLLEAPIQAVLNYWFGALGSANDDQVRSLWFTKSAATDADISTRFSTLIEAALAGGLQDWAATAQGRLARIVLLDQFTRNVFRGQARSFAGDPLALADAMHLLDQDRSGFEQLPPLQRWFALMPLEHAEDAAIQARCVAEFEQQARLDPRLQGALDYARKHEAVIQQFGRFPHRNPILGRDSSPAELAYLAQPGAGF